MRGSVLIPNPLLTLCCAISAVLHAICMEEYTNCVCPIPRCSSGNYCNLCGASANSLYTASVEPQPATIPSQFPIIDTFLAESFAFAYSPNLLGIVTQFHEKLAYAENQIHSPGCDAKPPWRFVCTNSLRPSPSPSPSHRCVVIGVRQVIRIPMPITCGWKIA